MEEKTKNPNDRHRQGYWHERWLKQKAEAKKKKDGRKPKDRHRPGYYREYNLKHPERLARIGIYVNPDGSVTDTRAENALLDVRQRAFERNLRRKELEWHEDTDEEDDYFGCHDGNWWEEDREQE